MAPPCRSSKLHFFQTSIHISKSFSILNMNPNSVFEKTVTKSLNLGLKYGKPNSLLTFFFLFGYVTLFCWIILFGIWRFVAGFVFRTNKLVRCDYTFRNDVGLLVLLIDVSVLCVCVWCILLLRIVVCFQFSFAGTFFFKRI